MARRVSAMLEPSGGFPMTPMLDIVFNLLIFFMLISRYMPPSLNVALPQADSSVMQDKPSISVSISASGELMVDGEMEPWDSLPQLMLERASQPGGDQTQVRIAADKTADYDYVVKAMDAASKAGLSQIALETAPNAH
jgi:biopolymer transport protein ExbD